MGKTEIDRSMERQRDRERFHNHREERKELRGGQRALTISWTCWKFCCAAREAASAALLQVASAVAGSTPGVFDSATSWPLGGCWYAI